MIDDLITIGLSRTEAEVYQAVLELGPCFVAPIIYTTRKHRQIIYNALGNLEKKNLVTVSKKNGKNFYSAGDPKRILIELKQKEIIAEDIIQSIEKKLKSGQERIEVFAGPQSYEQGLASFRMHAAEAGEYVVIGGESKDWYHFTRPFFARHVEEVRKLKRRGIDIYILFYERERESAEEFIGPYTRNPYLCKIAKDEYRLPHTAWLAGDNVYILTPSSDPLVVHMRSKALAEEYRKYFWSQWNAAHPL